MRLFLVSIFSVAATALVPGPPVAAQDTPGPASGQIIIDPKSKVTQPPAKTLAETLQQLLKEMQKKDEAKKVRGGPEAPESEHKKIDVKGFEIELKLDGGRIIAIQRKPEPAASIDQKLDRILQEMKELRRDLDLLKRKLDGKPMTRHIEIELGKDKLPLRFGTEQDPAIQKALEFLRKQQNQRGNDAITKPTPPPENIERTLQRVQQEIEALRRDLRASKAK